jgi:hypothetical protein
MTERRVLLSVPALSTLAGLLVLFFTKDDIEKTLNTSVTEVKPWPLKVVLGPEGLHDQACVFFAGSRTLRITVTETPSMSEAEQTYKNTVSGHAIMNSAKPMPLADVHDEAMIAASTVVMRRQNLVVNFSVADFANDDESRMSLGRALAQKVADRPRRLLGGARGSLGEQKARMRAL